MGLRSPLPAVLVLVLALLAPLAAGPVVHDGGVASARPAAVKRTAAACAKAKRAARVATRRRAKARTRRRAAAVCARARKRARAHARVTSGRAARPPSAPAPAAPAPPVAPAAGAPSDVPPPSAPAPSAPAPVQRDAPRWFGFNDNAVRAGQLSAADDAALTAGVGANVSRVTFDWRWVEPRRGTRDFGEYDAIYRALLARGIRPVWIVMFAPQWARDPEVSCNQWARECRYPPAREHLGEWRSFVAEVAERYPEAAAIEVWNEPNLQAFFRPEPDPARYTELLREAHAAVEAVDPGMPVLGGSLGNNEVDRPGGDHSLSSFLDAMYEHGARGLMAGLSFHPYPWSHSLAPGSLFARTFDRVRAIRDAHGDAGTPLWVTEVGVSTTGLDARHVFTEDEQAQISVDLLRTMTAMDDVEAVMLHTLVEAPADRPLAEIGYGIVRHDLTPKPAYCALARVRGARGCS